MRKEKPKSKAAVDAAAVAGEQVQGGTKGSDKCAKKTRSKRFCDSDFQLAKQLLERHDPHGMTGCPRWAGGFRERKQRIIETILSDFISVSKRKQVTKEKLVRLLEAIRRKERARFTNEDPLDVV